VAADQVHETDKPFVRKATSGGWKTVLPETTVAHLETHWGHVMQDLGYQLETPRLREARRLRDEKQVKIPACGSEVAG